MSDAETYCVIGAGPSGLAVAKTFRQHGIPVVVLERSQDVGGIWNFGTPHSSIYASTHLISSKRMTEYPDFPMPKSFPPYPSHRQALAYLRDYADHFRLREVIEFERTVTKVEPLDAANNESGWAVNLSDGTRRSFRGVVIANGHHSEPLWPELRGRDQFAGTILHARDYKSPDILVGKRVLVIGAGNSGCDIAVEASQHAVATMLSMRRGYHFLPKFLFGTPIDTGGERLLRWRLPLVVRRWITSLLSWIAVGKPERYGLPKPDHRLFEAHPIVNSQLLYFVGHGAIAPRPALKQLRQREVMFEDGTTEAVDVIICATGYRTTLPFLDARLVLEPNGSPKLFLNAFHPTFDHFFVAGLIQPNSGLWMLADWQARVMAAFIQAMRADVSRASRFRHRKAVGPSATRGEIQFVDSPRHRLEVDYFAYRAELQQELRLLGK